MDDAKNDSSDLEPRRDPRGLPERLDGPIEDISIGVSAMLGKFVRQALRGGVQKMDEEMSDSVRAKIDDDLRERGPQLAEEARATAQGVVEEQLQKLLRQARETAERVTARLDALEQQTIADRSDHQALVEELEQNRNRQAALDAEQTAALSRMRDETLAEFAGLRHEHAGAVEATLQGVAATRADAEAGLAAHRTTHAEELIAHRAAHAEELAQARTEFAAALAQARADRTAALAAAGAEQTAALTALRSEQTAALEQTRHDHASALAQTQKEHSAAVAELRRRQQAEAAALHGKLEDHGRTSADALRDAVAPVADRLGALEDKVFKPSLLGRLFGKKPPRDPA